MPSRFISPPVDLTWITDVTGPTADFVSVAPDLAKLWLDTNRVNRNLSTRNIVRYLADMEAGDWMLTGEAVKFAGDGRMLDGQHRLIGVSRASAPVDMLLVRGLDPVTQKYMDQGQARTTAQRFDLNGEKYSGVLAAVSKLAVQLERVTPTKAFDSADPISQSQQERWVSDNPDVRQAVDRWANRHPKGGTATTFAYTAFRTYRVSPEAAESFLLAMSTGADLPARSPILAARARLSNLAADQQVRPQLAILDLLFRAWTLWRTGKGAQTLQFRIPSRGELPELV